MFRRAGMGSGTIIPELLGLGFIGLIFWFMFVCIRDGFKIITNGITHLDKWLSKKMSPPQTLEEWLIKENKKYPPEDMYRRTIRNYMESQEVEDIATSLKDWGIPKEEVYKLIEKSLHAPGLWIGARVEDRIKYIIRNKAVWR